MRAPSFEQIKREIDFPSEEDEQFRRDVNFALNILDPRRRERRFQEALDTAKVLLAFRKVLDTLDAPERSELERVLERVFEEAYVKGIRKALREIWGGAGELSGAKEKKTYER